MTQWLHEHSAVIGPAANVAMVLTWLLYLQLFYRVFRQDRAVRVLLQPSGGTDTSSECRLVNMSASHVDVANVFLAVDVEGEEVTHPLEYLATRAAARSNSHQRDLRPRPRHGPIRSGGWEILGTFDDLLTAAHEAAEMNGFSGDAAVRSFELRVVFFSRTCEQPLAAYRAFHVQDRDHFWQVQPEVYHTHQLVSWPKRRLARQWYLRGGALELAKRSEKVQ